MSEGLLEVTPEAEPRPPMRRPSRRRWVAAAAAAGLAIGGLTAWVVAETTAASVGSSVGPAVPGAVTGQVPLCYGPGPDMNLTPTLVVVATQQGSTASTVTVPATLAAHTYRLSLLPGTYAVRAGSWPSAAITVRAGLTTVVDLPGGACL